MPTTAPKPPTTAPKPPVTAPKTARDGAPTRHRARLTTHRGVPLLSRDLASEHGPRAQFLTTPYLRIPLVLHFFADRTRVKAIASPKVQLLLDAALFEPGPWRTAHVAPLPACIPAHERSCLATPAGLLLNELRHSPASLVAAVHELLELALEMDGDCF